MLVLVFSKHRFAVIALIRHYANSEVVIEDVIMTESVNATLRLILFTK